MSCKGFVQAFTTCGLHALRPPEKGIDLKRLQEIVRLGIQRLGTWRKQKPIFFEKTTWPTTALRMRLLRSSALQNDGLDAPVILECRTSQETNPKGHWGPNYIFRKSLFCFLHVPSLTSNVVFRSARARAQRAPEAPRSVPHGPDDGHVASLCQARCVAASFGIP